MESFGIFKNVFVTVVTLGLLLVNPLTMVGILRSRRIRDDVMTPVLISVFLADMGVGLNQGVISTSLSWMHITDPPMWIVRLHSFYIFAPLANLMSITLLALLQTIAILKPLRFAVIVTRLRVALCLGALWTLSIILAIWTASTEVKYYESSRSSGTEDSMPSIVMALFVIILTVCHIIIFMAVIKQQIKTRTQTGADNAAPNAFLAAFKSAKRILAVTLTYLILYPTASLAMYFIFDPKAIFVCFWMAYSQGIFNSMFYLMFSKEAKKELKSLFCKSTEITTTTNQVETID